MNQLTTVELLRGISPNLAAGQRALRTPGNSPYQVCTVPHNTQFYDFGNGPFTIFFRYLDLGATRSYDQTVLVAKSSSGTGWDISKQGAAGNIRFQMKRGGGHWWLCERFAPGPGRWILSHHLHYQGRVGDWQRPRGH